MPPAPRKPGSVQPAPAKNAGSRRRSVSGRGTEVADLQLVLELLAIPGPSGQERAVGQYVVDKLREAGVTSGQIREDHAHRRSPLPAGEMGNLVVQLPGTRRGPRRLLMAHLDTVPICVGCRPVRRGRFIRSADHGTGLGADNRAGCAVVLHTALTLLRRRLDHPPITLVWTIQEEVGLQGARRLNLGLLGRPRYAFNWDGGAARKLTIGATGGYRMQIDVFGKASHAGGAPERGISAIAVSGLAISQLQQAGWHGAVCREGRVGTSNVGVIHGGSATNVVADHVQLLAEARSHDAEFRGQIAQQIESAFREAALQVRNDQGEAARVEIQGRLDYEAFCLPTDHPAVEVARQAVQRQGEEPELAIANGGLDANWLTARGIPTVSLGCGQLGQHTVDEALDLEEYRAACRIAMDLATHG